MIDMGCFDAVACVGEARTASLPFTPNPHPEIAEQQALDFGLVSGRTAGRGALSSGRSPYPGVVEQQFELGIR